MGEAAGHDHRVDAAQVRQVMLNLVGNAVRFSDSATQQGRSCVTGRAEGRATMYSLNHAEAKVIVTDREFSKTIAAALELATAKPLVIDYDDPEYGGAGDRLGGHLVQGHVDGVGVVEAVADRDDARLLDIRVPPVVADVTIPLGSVTVDGVSLTVNALPEPALIQVSLIPFTLQHTTLGTRRPGDRVHLEGDTLGKYVKALTGR